MVGMLHQDLVGSCRDGRGGKRAQKASTGTMCISALEIGPHQFGKQPDKKAEGCAGGGSVPDMRQSCPQCLCLPLPPLGSVGQRCESYCIMGKAVIWEIKPSEEVRHPPPQINGLIKREESRIPHTNHTGVWSTWQSLMSTCTHNLPPPPNNSNHHHGYSLPLKEDQPTPCLHNPPSDMALLGHSDFQPCHWPQHDYFRRVGCHLLDRLLSSISVTVQQSMCVTRNNHPVNSLFSL